MARNNVRIAGPEGGRPILFAHGFGCDQQMWRLVAPAFAEDRRVVLFDHVGSGGSDRAAYDRVRHATLDGFADDVLAICDQLELEHVAFVGHSVSATIGVLAAIRRPELFESLVLVGPSPRYLDDAGYVGGFSRADIDELLEALDSNYLGWSTAMAGLVMGPAADAGQVEELAAAFCRSDPEIMQAFARVTFLGDHRPDLERVRTRALVLQCSEDAIAPRAVGDYVHARIPGSELVVVNTTGHCPQLTAPEQTVAAIGAFL
jgi:sigma-B regulation protein RsbQ